MKKLVVLYAVYLFIGFSSASYGQTHAQNAPKAKYVFYFIGDGMGFTHVSMAEAYKAALEGKIGSVPLSFTRFPILGMATTYSANQFITCSSAAGTALSTGYKTNNNMLGVTPDTANLESMTYKIQRAGIPVGIMTTVTIDHATPAAFYAHSAARDDYHAIAMQLPKTNFNFFGGGGFREPTKNGSGNVYTSLAENGYDVAYGLGEFSAKKGKSKKMVLLQERGHENEILPYSIDRTSGDLTLAQVVSSAIEFLESDNGFFIMAEGGKIDWAAHSNDVKSDILEVLDLSDAVEVAYRFYLKHPDQTLIVVTADHETGGLAMGYEKGYSLFFKELSAQTASLDKDKTQAKKVKESTERARIGWTTSSHTGVAVPVFAIGVGSHLFSGRMDNTEIPKKIGVVMGINR